jgi:hypothetical protein
MAMGIPTVLFGIAYLIRKVKSLSLKLTTFQIFIYPMHKELRGY